jgi:hypothetical protein
VSRQKTFKTFSSEGARYARNFPSGDKVGDAYFGFPKRISRGISGISSNAPMPAAAKSDARRAASFEGSNENDIPTGNMVHNMKRRDDIGVKDLMLKNNIYVHHCFFIIIIFA